jgi:hypothetical protein
MILIVLPFFVLGKIFCVSHRARRGRETGPLECWSTGVLECWEKSLKSIPDHYSILPPFHYSICKRVTSVSSSVAVPRFAVYKAKRARDHDDFA